MSYTTMKIHPLEKDNFDTWKIQACALLTRNDEWGYVSGTIARSETNHVAWGAADAKAMANIILTISPSELKHIKGCKTSKEMWEKLESIYESQGPARKAMFLKRLIHHKMNETDDMRDHLANFFETLNKLEDMSIEINKELVTILLLYSIPDSYEPFRVAIESREILPSPETLKIKLQEEYDARKRNDNIGKQSEAMLASKFQKKKNHKTTKNYKTSPNNETFKFKCHKCHIIGHRARDCKSQKRFENKSEDYESSKVAEIAMNVTSDENTNRWCLDSGASSHMCSEKRKFNDVIKPKVKILNLANDESTEIQGVGTVKLKTKEGNVARLEQTLLVPDLRSNLLSVSKITNRGLEVIFRKNHAVVRDPKSQNDILFAKRDQDLYFIDERKETATVAEVKENDIFTWHKKLGHVNAKDLLALSDPNIAHGIVLNRQEKLPPCEICVQGKQRQNPFPTSKSRSSEVLELIHTDICGPMNVPSLGGSKYFITFIDDKSRWCEIRFLKKRSEMFERFHEFKTMVENRTGKRIKAIRSDNGTEYRSKRMEDFLKTEGIQHQLTIEYTPEQNGIAERFNRTLVEMARCMIIQSGLSHSFWAEAINTASYIRNRCPSQSLNGRTPHEVWTEKIPSLRYFQIFGSTAYMLNKAQKRKFDSKSIRCIFVGYANDSKAYRLWDPKAKKIRKSRDVKFFSTNLRGKENESFINKDFFEKSATRINNVEGSTTDSISEEDASIDINLSNDLEHAVEEENNIVDDVPEPDQPEMKIGRGRPRIIRTGQRGRPRRMPHMVPTEESTVSHEENRTNENVSIVENEEYHSADDNDLVEFAGLSAYSSDPETIQEAFASPEADEWKHAMLVEYEALRKNNTWILVDRPKGKNVIGSKWVLKTKYNADNTVEKRKARLVAKGFAQKPKIDFTETFAPVAKVGSIRLIIALAAELKLDVFQLDVVSAYLNGDIEEQIYMEIPEGLPQILGKRGTEKSSKVCLLKKALYGLKQSGRQWYRKLDSKLRQLKMKPLDADGCVYIYKRKNQVTLVAVYVDDIIIATNDQEKLQELKGNLAKSFEMKDLGRLHHCLGIEFCQDLKTKEIRMTQKQYIENILKRFNMENCKPISTPVNVSMKLAKSMNPKTEEQRKEMEKVPYRELVGSLMYLATSTRPDIAHIVSALGQYNNDPGEEHWKAAKRVLRYLKNTENRGLTYQKSNESLAGYSDADWAANVDDRRSYTGYAFTFAGAAINWISRKQKTVAMSTAEAEYVALSEATKEAIHLRRFLFEVLGTVEATTIFCDNQSAGLMAKNPVFHERTKHIAIKYHFVREVIESKDIIVKYLPTEEMPADVLTKGLCLPKHELCATRLGLK